jgi:hypothetical protein
MNNDSVLKLTIFYLSLIFLITLSVPAAYAHNSFQQTKSSSYKSGIAKTDNYAPSIANRTTNNILAQKGHVSANHNTNQKNHDLVGRSDDRDENCHRYFCENLSIGIANTTNKKPEYKCIVLSAHIDSVSVKPITTVTYSRFVTSLTLSLLQGTLRYRVLLV